MGIYRQSEKWEKLPDSHDCGKSSLVFKLLSYTFLMKQAKRSIASLLTKYQNHRWYSRRWEK